MTTPSRAGVARVDGLLPALLPAGLGRLAAAPGPAVP
jgi:hypothetical protein